MISNLHIENAAVIDKADIEFEKGLNALTGETGAGKSVIIDSVNLLTGERSSRDIVRNGAEKTVIEGVIYPEDQSVFDILEENGIEFFEGDPIVLRREIKPDGKNTVRINGNASTTSLLRKICSKIINIHGQTDNQEILNVSFHGEISDRYFKIEKLLEDYRKTFSVYKEKQRELDKILKKEKEIKEKKEILDFKVAEIEGAKLKPNETEVLKMQREKFLNSEKIRQAAQNACYILSGSDSERGISDLLAECIENISVLGGFDSSFAEIADKMREARYFFDDAKETVFSLNDGLDEDLIDINKVEQRLDTISNLKKKYGDTEEEILNVLEDLKKEKEISDNFDSVIQKLTAEKDKYYKEVLEKAKVISKARHEGAERLSKLINNEFSELEMGSSEFKIGFTENEPDENGAEKAEFLISPNKGEPFKPICKIASGGELSRIILALKVVLSDSDKVSSMIFDEVDTGVSGSAAEKIGRKLKQVSKNKQVFVITHLPQVASFADFHYKVTKTEKDGKAVSNITLLNENEKIREIARLMSGSVINDSALKAAEEMLKVGKEI